MPLPIVRLWALSLFLTLTTASLLSQSPVNSTGRSGLVTGNAATRFKQVNWTGIDNRRGTITMAVHTGLVNNAFVIAPPFDETSFGTASTLSANGSSIGFNAGVDVAHFFTQRVGIGGMLQFSRASVEIEGASARR